jgi:hypothetical protein
MSELLLDRAGRPRSPATMPGFHADRSPRNKGFGIPPIRPRWRRSSPSCARPATVRTGVVARPDRDPVAGRTAHPRGARARRGRPRSAPRRRVVRRGNGERRREVGMDAWAWTELQPWLQIPIELPVGPLFCVLTGPTPGAPVVQRRRPHRPTQLGARSRRSAALRAGAVGGRRWLTAPAGWLPVSTRRRRRRPWGRRWFGRGACA